MSVEEMIAADRAAWARIEAEERELMALMEREAREAMEDWLSRDGCNVSR